MAYLPTDSKRIKEHISTLFTTGAADLIKVNKVRFL